MVQARAGCWIAGGSFEGQFTPIEETRELLLLGIALTVHRFSRASEPQAWVYLFESLLSFDKRAKPSHECYACAVALLRRVGGAGLESCKAGAGLPKVLVAALILAIKTRDDEWFSNNFYAKLSQRSLASVSAAEVALLWELDWSTTVSPDEFASVSASCREEARLMLALREVPSEGSSVCTLMNDGSGFGILFRDTRIAGTIPRSPACEAGLLPGTVIARVNGMPVTSMLEITQALCGQKTAVLELCETTLYRPLVTSELPHGVRAP